MGGKFGISRCKPVYRMNKVLLYSMGNYVQYSVISHNGKGYEKESIYIIYITESLCFTAEINPAL